MTDKEKTRRQRRLYLLKNPWVKHIKHARERCNNKNHKAYRYYGGRGIKCHLKTKDGKFLWFRDGADQMKKPSIDRINPDKDYTLDNCRFLEEKDNVGRRRVQKK